MKKYKLLILMGLLSLFITSCGTVKKAFDPQRKNSSEEFLVEKKSPLSMPPDFDELPVPQNKNENIQDQSKDIKLLIIENDMENNQTFDVESSDKDFELLILDKIKNN
jgi:hypothetical protein